MGWGDPEFGSVWGCVIMGWGLVMLILLLLIGVVQLAPQHEVASRTHRSTIN